MNYPNREILVSSLWMKNFSSWLECLTSARRTAEYALFFHPVWITHDLVRLPKINWYSWVFPVSWSIFFYSSMKQLSCPFGRFSSVYQWNIKRNFSLDVYLITLTIHRWDSFASSTWFGFFSSWVLWFGQQFSNFKESYELGVYALPDCLATDITFHRSYRGFLYY